MRRDALVVDPAIAPLGALDVRRTPGSIVASWQRRDVDDAGAGPPALAGFGVAVVGEDGALVRRDDIDAPPELHARRGSVEQEGVDLEDGTSLVHWVATTTATDPDGRLRTAAALDVAYAGRASAAVHACMHCAMAASFVSFGDGSVAIVRIDPDVVDVPAGAEPPAATFVAVRLGRDGTASVEPLPWIVVPSSTTDRSIDATVDDDGRITIATGGWAWLTDRSLAPSSGPVALPGPDAVVGWGAAADAVVAWSVSPFTEGRASTPTVPREVFTGLVPPGAAAMATRERVSRGRAVLAADRRGDDVGVVFESAGRTFFAATSPAGKKRGGDVLVASSGQPDSEYGTFTPRDVDVLVATGDGRFTSVTLGSGALVSTEIACAP